MGEAIMSEAVKQNAYREFVVDKKNCEDDTFRWAEILEKVMHCDVLDKIWREPPSSENEVAKLYRCNKDLIETLSIDEIGSMRLTLPILTRSATAMLLP
jgi:hypothetical protein